MMKNYLELRKVVRIGSDSIIEMSVDGVTHRRRYDPTKIDRDDLFKCRPPDSLHAQLCLDTDLNPIEQPTFEAQLEQAGWTATPEQLARWNKDAEEFYQRHIQTHQEVKSAKELASLWTRAVQHTCKTFFNEVEIKASETQTIKGFEGDDEENEKPRFDFVLRSVDEDTVLTLIHEITETDFASYLQHPW
jgi:hypothetical protein